MRPQKAFAPIFRDGRAKVLALLISLAVWFYARARLQTVETRQATVSLRLPAEHVLLHQSLRTVRLRLRGPGPMLKKIGDLELAVRVRPEEIEDGRFEFDLRKRFGELGLDLPRRQRVQLDIRPMRPAGRGDLVLEAAISRLVEKRLRVEIDIEGQPRHGFRLGRVSATPPEVTARGPARVLENLATVSTAPLVVWNVNEDFRRRLALLGDVEVPLAGGDETQWRLALRPEEVDVSVTVEPEEVERTFRDVHFVWWAPEGFPYEYEVREVPLRVTVRVKGRRAAVQGLAPEQLTVYVDLQAFAKEKIEPGQSRPYKEPLRLLPPGVELSGWQVEPETVTILLKNPQKAVE
jgi:hypothetical protein